MLLSLARALLASLAILLVVAWVMDGSSSFKHCVQDKQAAIDPPKDNIAAILFEVSVSRDCFVSFVKEHKDEVLAAFTIVLTFATIFLWFATGDLVRGAERTAKRQLRAYIGISNVTITKVVVNEKPIIEIRFKNFGQTPAYKLRTWTDSILESVDTPQRLLKFDKEWKGESVLNPSDSHTKVSTKKTAITVQEADAILHDTSRLFVRGEAQYRDAFGKKRHVYFGFETGGSDLIKKGQMIVSDGQNTAT